MKKKNFFIRNPDITISLVLVVIAAILVYFKNLIIENFGNIVYLAILLIFFIVALGVILTISYWVRR